MYIIEGVYRLNFHNNFLLNKQIKNQALFQEPDPVILIKCYSPVFASFGISEGYLIGSFESGFDGRTSSTFLAGCCPFVNFS